MDNSTQDYDEPIHLFQFDFGYCINNVLGNVFGCFDYILDNICSIPKGNELYFYDDFNMGNLTREELQLEMMERAMKELNYDEDLMGGTIRRLSYVVV